jgi:hypothetical protein
LWSDLGCKLADCIIVKFSEKEKTSITLFVKLLWTTTSYQCAVDSEQV